MSSPSRHSPGDESILSLADSTNTDNANRVVEDHLLVQAFARLRPVPLGISLGLMGGVLVFGATAILLVKALLGWTEGPVGPHLALLRHYFPGYSITWIGAFVGLCYGIASGFALGSISAVLVNSSHFVHMRLLVRKLRGRAIQDAL